MREDPGPGRCEAPEGVATSGTAVSAACLSRRTPIDRAACARRTSFSGLFRGEAELRLELFDLHIVRFDRL